MLKSLESLIKKDYSNTAAIVIYKKNQLVYERYFNGFNRKDSIHLTSVTKSISSILIGIAVDRGLIKSVEDKVLDYFPNYTLKRGEKTLQSITIKDLLTMTAPYKFKSEPYSKVLGSDDWTLAALDLLGGRGQIGEFKYTSMGVQILSGIIKEVSGMSLKDFAHEYLFKVLSIDCPNDSRIVDRESYMNFIKYKGDNTWIKDPQGNHTIGWGLTLKASDLAKIGLMVLNDGQYKNHQIVSKQWICDSCKISSYWHQLAYGYMWWLVDENSFAAIGDGGNIIYVNKKLDIVVVMTATFKPRYEDRIKLIKEHIIDEL